MSSFLRALKLQAGSGCARTGLAGSVESGHFYTFFPLELIEKELLMALHMQS
jgi:hypothetical protein